MHNIKEESQILSSSQLDIDLLRRQYKKRDGDVTVHFVSPYLLAYEKYRQYLLVHSTKKKLEKQYYYRPDYLSFDVYGTTVFWTVLMFINNVNCLENFVIDEVYIPSYFAISQMSVLNKEEKNITDLDDVVVEKELWPKLYQPANYSEYISDESVSVYANLETYRKETFVIDMTAIQNQYIELSQVPLIESIVVRIRNQIFIPLYGVHYTVKADEFYKYKVLSWADSDVPSGKGMKKMMLLDTILEIQYQTESSS